MVRATWPIYGEEGRVPDLLGSFVLVRIAERFFILTAAHVLDHLQTTKISLGLVAPSWASGANIHDERARPVVILTNLAPM